nr:plasmid segregation protein, also known as parM [Enterobacter sp.]
MAQLLKSECPIPPYECDFVEALKVVSDDGIKTA